MVPLLFYVVTGSLLSVFVGQHSCCVLGVVWSRGILFATWCVGVGVFWLTLEIERVPKVVLRKSVKIEEMIHWIPAK